MVNASARHAIKKLIKAMKTLTMVIPHSDGLRGDPADDGL
jgi:hypothetical protein